MSITLYDNFSQVRQYIDQEKPDLSSYVSKSELSEMSYATTSQLPVIDENIIPKETNTYTLGNVDHLYSSTYSSRLKIGNNSQIYNDGGGITFSVNSNNGIRIGSSSIYPKTSKGYNNGSSTNLWNATYTGYLYLNNTDIFSIFQRKPVVVWEANDSSTGLTALETDLTNTPTWQLTGLDFSPYKRVKIYTKAAQKSGATASASTTPSFVLEMILDDRAKGPYANGAFIGSTVLQKINDENRIATLTCVISSDKTSFSVYRMTNLYGTAATGNSDVGGYVFLIEGYYD